MVRVCKIDDVSTLGAVLVHGSFVEILGAKVRGANTRWTYEHMYMLYSTCKDKDYMVFGENLEPIPGVKDTPKEYVAKNNKTWKTYVDQYGRAYTFADTVDPYSPVTVTPPEGAPYQLTIDLTTPTMTSDIKTKKYSCVAEMASAKATLMSAAELTKVING